VEAAFTVSGCGSVNPTSGVTNSQGQVTTTYTPGSSCCGTATITATAPSLGATAQTQITVACHNMLPTTSGTQTLSSLRPATPVWALVMMIVALVVLAGSGSAFLLRRKRA